MIGTSREDQDNFRKSSEVGTIARDSQQPTNLQDNPVYFSSKRSVAALDKCGQKHNLVLCVCLDNMLTLQEFYMHWQLQTVCANGLLCKYMYTNDHDTKS